MTLCPPEPLGPVLGRTGHGVSTDLLGAEGISKGWAFLGNCQSFLQSGPRAAKEQVPYGHPGQLCTHLDLASLAVVRIGIAWALPAQRDHGKV